MSNVMINLLVPSLRVIMRQDYNNYKHYIQVLLLYTVISNRMQCTCAGMSGCRLASEVFEDLLEEYRREEDTEVLEELADMMETMALENPDVANIMSDMFESGDTFPRDKDMAELYRKMIG